MISPLTNIDLKGIAALFRDLDDFVICGHVNPDGDCLGSQLALCLALREMGKRVVCLLTHDAPIDPVLEFLPGIKDMVCASEFSGTAQAFIVCDVSGFDRIGEAAAAIQEASKATFTLDHHRTEETMSQYVYIDPDIASTSMIIWELIKVLGITPSHDMTLCAYTGLITDTGNFKYANTDVAAFQAAAEMTAVGIDPSEVSRFVYQNRRLASLRLEGILLSRIMIDEAKRYVISYLSLADFESVGAEKSDADLLIDALRSLEGVRVACFLRENEDGVRANLRAKDATDVSLIAKRFGGGGHKAAAGCTIHLPLDEAVARMRDALEAMV